MSNIIDLSSLKQGNDDFIDDVTKAGDLVRQMLVEHSNMTAHDLAAIQIVTIKVLAGALNDRSFGMAFVSTSHKLLEMLEAVRSEVVDEDESVSGGSESTDSGVGDGSENVADLVPFGGEGGCRRW